MNHNEGLILQGCGGNLKEWVVGINDMLTNEGILRNGDKINDISVFDRNGLTK